MTRYRLGSLWGFSRLDTRLTLLLASGDFPVSGSHFLQERWDSCTYAKCMVMTLVLSPEAQFPMLAQQALYRGATLRPLAVEYFFMREYYLDIKTKASFQMLTLVVSKYIYTNC